MGVALQISSVSRASAVVAGCRCSLLRLLLLLLLLLLFWASRLARSLSFSLRRGGSSEGGSRVSGVSRSPCATALSVRSRLACSTRARSPVREPPASRRAADAAGSSTDMDERRHGGFQVPRSSWSHRRGRWRSRWMPNKVNRSPRQQFGVYATHAQHGRSGRTPLDIRRRSLSLSPGRGGRVRLRRSTTTPPPPPQGDSSPAPSSSHPSHQHEPLGDPPGAQDEEGEDGQRKEPPPRKKLRVYGPTRYHDETIRDVPELEAEAKPEVKVKSERNQRNVERSAEAAETLMVKSEIVSVQPQNDRMVRPTVKSQIVKVEPKIEPQADTKKEPEADTKKQPQVEGKEELKVQPQSEQKPEPSRHGEKRHASSDKPDTSPDTAVEEPVLGIDLGTTNSVVAVVQDGDVEVLHNDICSRLTPSCVHVSDVRQVGEGALRLAVTDPDKTVRNIKCVLGRNYQD
ncbi:hypothetical protein FOCC_FOCC012307, partial [Frankliniella occidentalis]